VELSEAAGRDIRKRFPHFRESPPPPRPKHEGTKSTKDHEDGNWLGFLVGVGVAEAADEGGDDDT